jgi:hypothetical protein
MKVTEATMQPLPLTIRRATPADAPQITRLAELDAKRPPSGDVLIAFSAGSPIAALSATDGHEVADPFKLSAEAIELMRLRAAQEHETERRSWLRALRRARVPAPMLR